MTTVREYDCMNAKFGSNNPGGAISLVVDLEDRKEVERLWVALRDGLALRSRDNLATALREFANPTPPKPDEPTGLGAVVEAECGCSDGRRTFIHDPLSPRFEGRPCAPEKTWKSACGHHKWSDLDAVKVLSDGIPA